VAVEKADLLKKKRFTTYDVLSILRRDKQHFRFFAEAIGKSEFHVRREIRAVEIVHDQRSGNAVRPCDFLHVAQRMIVRAQWLWKKRIF